jgi:hypothetical protein
VISSGRSAMAKSSSSVTPTMRTRRTRTPPSTPSLLHLLLQTPRIPPPPHPMPTKHPMGCQMIMLTVGTKPVRLRRSRQDNAYREACFKEIWHDRALLHHNFFCTEE